MLLGLVWDGCGAAWGLGLLEGCCRTISMRRRACTLLSSRSSTACAAARSVRRNILLMASFPKQDETRFELAFLFPKYDGSFSVNISMALKQMNIATRFTMTLEVYLRSLARSTSRTLDDLSLHDQPWRICHSRRPQHLRTRNCTSKNTHQCEWTKEP